MYQLQYVPTGREASLHAPHAVLDDHDWALVVHHGPADVHQTSACPTNAHFFPDRMRPEAPAHAVLRIATRGIRTAHEVYRDPAGLRSS